MITGIEKAILDRKPDIVLVYGDTNSTLAAAVAASKLHVPVAHIEAGLRSFNKRMPEEINRILCDHASAYLFVPTLQGMKNLLREGFPVGNQPPFSNDHPGVFHCGDVMYDNTLHFAEIAERKSAVMMNHQLNEGGFVLVTIHRDSNTDSQERLQQIVRAVTTLADRTSIIFFVPLHPRTSKMLQSHPDDQFLRVFTHHPRIILSEPVSFLDMTMLEKNAALVITDSGGVQKEAYFFRKPCVILRPQTEWTEIVDAKAAVLADADCDRIIRAGEGFLAQPPIDFPPIFGDGKAAEFICNTLTASVKG
jgi:UDP-GlcNAc3NAcA epimerase